MCFCFFCLIKRAARSTDAVPHTLLRKGRALFLKILQPAAGALGGAGPWRPRALTRDPPIPLPEFFVCFLEPFCLPSLPRVFPMCFFFFFFFFSDGPGTGVKPPATMDLAVGAAVVREPRFWPVNYSCPPASLFCVRRQGRPPAASSGGRPSESAWFCSRSRMFFPRSVLSGQKRTPGAGVSGVVPPPPPRGNALPFFWEFSVVCPSPPTPLTKSNSDAHPGFEK